MVVSLESTRESRDYTVLYCGQENKIYFTNEDGIEFSGDIPDNWGCTRIMQLMEDTASKRFT